MGSFSGIFMFPFMLILYGVDKISAWIETITWSDLWMIAREGITHFFQNTDFNAVGDQIANLWDQLASFF